MSSHNLFSALRAAFPSDLDAVAVETDDGLNYSWRDLDRATAMMANLLESLDLRAYLKDERNSHAARRAGTARRRDARTRAACGPRARGRCAAPSAPRPGPDPWFRASAPSAPP